jgi:Pectate lyase superfamily protein
MKNTTLVRQGIFLGVSLGLSVINFTSHYLWNVSAAVSQTTQKEFPADIGLKNVKDYGAKGDGVTDDTAAIQRAISEGRSWGVDYSGKPRSVYFPAGTYLVSNTIWWPGCCMTLQGQGAGATVIKLKNSASGFTNASTPKAVFSTPSGNMSFRQNFHDLTVDVGSNNPGAIGIDYIANNNGILNNITLKSSDGKGAAGLEMVRGWAGPCMIKNLNVQGFDYGIRAKNAEYGPTFEHISVSNQNVAGISNTGNMLAIRKLTSKNSVPAIKNSDANGMVTLVDANLQGGSSSNYAIENNGHLYARKVSTSGYKAALFSKGKQSSTGTYITEHVSGGVYSLFPSPAKSLNLAIEETPEFHDNNLGNWGRFVDNTYGDTAGLQPLMDSGKSTIYFPGNRSFLMNDKVINVPASVKRIIGFDSVINGTGLILRVSGNSSEPLIIERFGGGVKVERASARPVVLKTGKYGFTDAVGSGKLFLEDIQIRIPFTINGTKQVWARQLNLESGSGPAVTKVSNSGAQLWILGIKTEGAGTVINTFNKGASELLGTLNYPVKTFTAEDQKLPAFINNESSVSLIYAANNYKGSVGNHQIQVREIRDGVTRDFNLNQIPYPFRMPLFSGQR